MVTAESCGWACGRMRAMRDVLPVLAFLLILTACGSRQLEREAAARTGGHPAKGSGLILKYGCNACHLIPGAPEPRTPVGPPLAGLARRVYLAGAVANRPQNLILWIRDPQAVVRGTAMPNLGVTDQDGRDIAAYLYTLR